MDIRIEHFIEQAHLSRHSPSAITSLCLAEKQAIWAHYSTDNSRRVRLTNYRNRIKAESLPDQFLVEMNLPRELTKALRDTYTATVRTTSDEPRPIADHQAIVDKALWCLEHWHYPTVFTGLALLSGRRAIELCVLGDFYGDDSALPPNHVWFSGQAKTRDDERAQASYVIPLLCEPDRFLAAFARFHTLENFSVYDPEAHGEDAKRRFKKYGKPFGKAYREHFGPLMPSETTPSSLRDVYALVAYHWYCTAVHHNATAYMRQILGHEDAGSTTQSYQGFYLAEYPRIQWGYK